MLLMIMLTGPVEVRIRSEGISDMGQKRLEEVMFSCPVSSSVVWSLQIGSN